MNSLLEWLGYDAKLHYHHRIAYVINGFSLMFAAVFSIIYGFVMRYTLAVPGIIAYLISSLIVFILLKQRKYSSAKLLILLGFILQESSIVFFLFPVEFHFNLFFFIIAPITFFVFDYASPTDRKLTYFFSGVAILLFTLSELVPSNPNAYLASNELTAIFASISAFSALFSITIVFYFFAAEISKANRELNQLANTDGLTKIYNRRYFFEVGKNQFHLAEKYNRPFCLMLMDLDHFKNINDTYGHPAGDSVLVELSKLIRDQVRKSDVFSRYGGEEFMMLLKDTDEAEGVQIAEKIRKSVMTYNFEALAGTNQSVTVSLGVVEFSSHYHSFDEMVKAVDGALYMAKEKGRNQVKTVL